MNITKEQIEEWLDDIGFSSNIRVIDEGDKKTLKLAYLIFECFNDLSPKWVSVNSSKPKQGVRVLLKTEFDENCPFVVGYWGCGEWEARTVNVEADADYNGNIACVERAFVSNDVTHWMPLKPPK